MMDTSKSSSEMATYQNREKAEDIDEGKIPMHEVKENTGLLRWWGYRHTIALMSFWAVAVSYAQRVGLSLVIVAMNDWNSTQKTGSEYLDWSEDHVHTILSSFFWGYIITQIPAGLIAERFGPKFVVSTGVGLCSIINLLSPAASSVGWKWLCACRVIQGLGQGVIYPALHVLFSRWVPPEERGRLAPFAYAGAQFGTVIAMPICGWLSSTKGAGWPSPFYLFGGIGLLWTISWILFASSSPEDHRWISVREKNYILKSLGKHRQQVKSENKHLSTPWKEIWTSLPFWAIILANCGQNWGFCTLLTEMPTYMSAVLHFNLNENGLLSALPHLVMWIFSIFIGWISDKAQEKKLVSKAVTRKLGNSIALWGPGLALLVLGFIPENKPILAVGLLTAAVGLNGASYIGFQVNHLDLSPNFAGTLMGIANCLSNIMGIIAPLVAGKIAYDETNGDLWRIVFFVSAAIYFVFNLFFIIFGSVEIQPWNNLENNFDEESAETVQMMMRKNQKDTS